MIGLGANAYGGAHVPDIAGNIRVDQAWGLFQIAGILHNVNASYNNLGAGGAPNTLSEISGHPEDKWGGAVTAALQIKNIPTGAGNDIKIDATYSKGSTKAVISTSGGSPNFAMSVHRCWGWLPEHRLGGRGFRCGLRAGWRDIKLTEAYGVRGAFNHNWDPYWSTSLWGSYAA